eukprot:s1585_g2.t1
MESSACIENDGHETACTKTVPSNFGMVAPLVVCCYGACSSVSCCDVGRLWGSIRPEWPYDGECADIASQARRLQPSTANMQWLTCFR